MTQTPLPAQGPVDVNVRHKRVPNRLECWLSKTASQMMGQAAVEHERNKSIITAFARDIQEAQEMAKEQEALFLDWLQFASDVMPGCGAGKDWLDSLRERTWRILSD